MAKFSKVSREQAPSPGRHAGRLAARMREYEGYVGGLKAGEVGKLVPGRGETVRGIALRVSRAGGRMNRSVSTWVVDGAVYFETK